MLDRAMALTRTHVLAREQFGQPLARFQGVQFQLTDAEVERAGVEELAKYALWSIQAAAAPRRVDDALALRLAAIEAAETVFRISHQLHGAMGFCDEIDAVVDLALQPAAAAASRGACPARCDHLTRPRRHAGA